MRPGGGVAGAVEADVVARGDDHEPLPGGRVPDHFRVAEGAEVGVGDDRVAGELFEGVAPVGAVRDRLRLRLLGRVGVVVRKERDDGPGAVSGGVFGINHCTTAENIAQTVGRERDGVVGPMDEVRARGMSPMHGAPVGAGGVELVIQMINAIQEEHAVGVVHPHFFGGEVEERAAGFEAREVVVGRLREVGVGGDEVRHGLLRAGEREGDEEQRGGRKREEE
mmetsp:Transcript_19879/g.49350  ORF Transcript_19879/g.49350 Transcript_19879/m.49350 type:complete len:223 (+) Transcript_19879:2-670(+)